MTAAKLRLAQAAMSQPRTKVGELCAELGVTRQTLYRHRPERPAQTGRREAATQDPGDRIHHRQRTEASANPGFATMNIQRRSGY